MKNILVKIGFRIASWLYKQGIIAPQLLSHEDGAPVEYIKVLTSNESEELKNNGKLKGDWSWEINYQK
jgi:hypothetical protein